MNNEQQPITKWIQANLWNLIVTFAIIVATYSVQNNRILALEEKQQGFPSVDYFELKFKTIDEKIVEIREKQNSLEKKIDTNIRQGVTILKEAQNE